jgi:hypothetical protein
MLHAAIRDGGAWMLQSIAERLWTIAAPLEK